MAQKMSSRKPENRNSEEITFRDALLTISPNPAADRVEIKLKVPDSKGFYLELYDKSGNRLVQKEWRTEPLDISRLAEGLYIICLRRNKEVYSQKLLIDR